MWLGIGGRLPLGGALEAIEEPREDLEQKNDTVWLLFKSDYSGFCIKTEGGAR